MRTRNQQRKTLVASGKTPMEDFLFLLVISLAVSVSFISKKQLANRFALPERRLAAESIAQPDYDSFPILELRDEGAIVFDSVEYLDHEQLLGHLQQDYSAQPKDEPDAGILMRVAYQRPSGEVEELEDRITELGINIFTEYETRK